MHLPPRCKMSQSSVSAKHTPPNSKIYNKRLIKIYPQKLTIKRTPRRQVRKLSSRPLIKTPPLFLGRRYDTPYERMGVSDPGEAALPRNFCPRPEFFQTRPKTDARPARKQKNFALAFLKAAWLQIPYWVHFTFKVSNPIYIYVHFHLVNKPLSGISFRKVKPSTKNVINLEVKKITKSSSTLRL